MNAPVSFYRDTPDGQVAFHVRDGYTFMMFERAQECRFCHVMRHFAINRAGQTRCVDCDRTLQEPDDVSRIR